ncbi:uncharacterized protein LOC123313378 isoform X2 [Coccinella septempunctata]|uniref:uncharacterized protein LOC123313378 isoform X2 n=1 Tax=Coccinella septempunctata TaxID=41139 RepID=UPI001D072F77|nr:uncharacterized protein LOC123313378 isoform X2 [Coccinella septempunctata]
MDDNYMEILKEIFPNRSTEQIEDVIEMVQENGEVEYNLETMINLLTESGESTIFEHTEGLDEAAGFGHNEGGYGHRTRNRCDAIFAQLSDVIPDADPDYLRKESELLAEQPNDDLHQFILDTIDSNNYPTRKDYLIRQRNVDEIRKFTRHFTVEGFLDVIPNPAEYFNSPNYVSSLSDENISALDEDYALKCLMNIFPYLREKDIVKIFKRRKNLIQASDILARVPRHFKNPRIPCDINEDCDNIKLLQEIAFIENRNEIKTAIKMKDEHYRLAREEAEKFGLLETCQCCYFEGLLPEECYFCKKSCPFCKECVQKGVEHAIGEGKLNFPCLTNCNSEFDISTLRMVLNKKTFDPLFTKIQMEEVKKANIDGLETCPFCDFSMILSSEQKIFKCQNVDCMEETCRECRHKSHVPYRCNEIEYDEDVRRRTYIENKMTEALVRCPLYTQDLKQFHADRVIKSAVKAKEELGLNQNPQLLKIDPTEGLVEYFQGL